MTAPASYEVFPKDGGYSWHLVSEQLRPLVYPQEIYPTDALAAAAARDARDWHKVCAERVDGERLFA